MAEIKSRIIVPIFNVKRLIAAVTFTAVVVLLTHIPQEVMPPQLQVIGLDKLAHALVYGAITFFFILSIRPSLTLLLSAIIFLGILAFAAFDELTQPLVNRTASVFDWLADITGICAVCVFKTWKSFSIRR